MMETLAERHSTREFSDKEISDTTLSSLLWAANGINRPDGHRTAPSALNKQEIDIYVFDKKGVWLYEAPTNTLTPCVEGDHRSLLCGGQEFVTEAPLTLLLVANGDRFELTGPQANLMMAADAGIVCENINLFCSSAGLATVPRASMDTNAIVSLLGLPAGHLPATCRSSTTPLAIDAPYCPGGSSRALTRPFLRVVYLLFFRKITNFVSF